MAVPEAITDLNLLVMLITLVQFLHHPDMIDDSLEQVESSLSKNQVRIS